MIKKYRPFSPGRRFMTREGREEITKNKPEKKLLKSISTRSGRNNQGVITTRHRRGGKKLYRIIDFKRDKYNIEGIVEGIEYDPNRSARIALLRYADGEKRYILAPLGLKPEDKVISGENVEPNLGNSLPLKNIPEGTFVHNVEINFGKGGQLARSAGSYAQILSKDEEYVQLKLPSGEIRSVFGKCFASIGRLSNPDHGNISLGKAGSSFHRGIRPTVRGVAMNTVDHPHGGGRGKGKGGNNPSSPTGVPAKGYKTRKSKPSDKLIIKRRK